MDYFLYQVAVEQLRGAKYVHELEALVRKWYGELQRIPIYNSSTTYVDFKLVYKLLKLSLNLFAEKSKKKLPDIIYALPIKYQQNIIYRLYNIADTSMFSPLLDYNEFIDFFEFDTVVETPQYNEDCISILHGIVLDKPLHFKFKFNQCLYSFDKYSTSTNISIQYNLFAIRLKQTLSPNTPSTVLDQYVADTLAEIDKHVDISEDIILLQQHTAALQTYQSTYGALVNG